jgi:uncharacterized membrane protein YdjX (TVP38/TMEM64 family)
MTAHDHPPQSTDMKAAFLGLIIGAIVLFAIVRTIVAMTNAKYAHEQPAAAATK